MYVAAGWLRKFQIYYSDVLAGECLKKLQNPKPSIGAWNGTAKHFTKMLANIPESMCKLRKKSKKILDFISFLVVKHNSPRESALELLYTHNHGV